jgi:hypothetical protein
MKMCVIRIIMFSYFASLFEQFNFREMISVGVVIVIYVCTLHTYNLSLVRTVVARNFPVIHVPRVPVNGARVPDGTQA